MEMACTDMAIRLEVDGLAMGSSASKKSWSLELLLTLHYPLLALPLTCTRWSAARCCGARPSAAAQLERATRYAMRPPVGRAHTHTLRPCSRQCGGLISRRTRPASLHSHKGRFGARTGQRGGREVTGPGTNSASGGHFFSVDTAASGGGDRVDTAASGGGTGVDTAASGIFFVVVVAFHARWGR